MSRTQEICRFALEHMTIVEAAATAVQSMTTQVFGSINGTLRELAETRGWAFGVEEQIYGYAIPLGWRNDPRPERCHRYQLGFHPYARPRYPLAALLRRVPGHYAVFSVSFSDHDIPMVLDRYEEKSSELRGLGVGLIGNRLEIPFILDTDLVLDEFEKETLTMHSEAMRPVDDAIVTLKRVHRPIRDIVEAVLHRQKMER